MTRFTTRFGELMGITGLPETYAGYEELLDTYEAERFEFDPANKRVTEATIRIGRATAPWYLKPGFRRVSIALMDEPLRIALGMEEQPRWLVRAVDPGLRLRAKALRFLPPRRAPYERTHPTYPNGYELSPDRPGQDARRAEQDLEQGVARCLSARPRGSASTSRSTRTSAPPRAPSWRRRSSPSTTSGSRTARSTARCGARPARPDCSASTSTRSTAGQGSRTSATTSCSSRRSPAPAPAGSASRCTTT